MARAPRVAIEQTPLSVARRSFGVTKPLSSRLDWRLFNGNRARHNSVFWPSVAFFARNAHATLVADNLQIVAQLKATKVRKVD